MARTVLKYKVVLTPEQRNELQTITRQTSVGVAHQRWATILLLADESHPDGRRTDDQIAEVVGLCLRQLGRIRKKFVVHGLAPTLVRTTRSDAGIPKVFDGPAEAQLVTLCCSTPPKGRDHWTLQLLCDELARLKVVTSVCPETVRQCLKKTNCSPGKPNDSASPREIDRGLSREWKRFSTCTNARMTPSGR